MSLFFFAVDDQHSHLLTPSFALSGIVPDPPTYDKMTPEEVSAFLTEMEPDIRAADRDMLEIDTLEKKGVLGAGKLPGKPSVSLSLWVRQFSFLLFAEYEKLNPRLQAVLEGHEKNVKLAASLEVWIASLVQRHATYVCLCLLTSFIN